MYPEITLPSSYIVAKRNWLQGRGRGQKNGYVICGRSLIFVICGLPLNMTYNTVISQVALHHLSISIPDISTQKACLMDGVFRLRLLKNKFVILGLREAWEQGTINRRNGIEMLLSW